jgi:hypothetical protein
LTTDSEPPVPGGGGPFPDVITDFDGNGGADGDQIDLSAIDADVRMIPAADDDQAFLPSQVSYNMATGLLNVNVFGDPGIIDLQIDLGVGTPLNLTDDIIF